ncbi:hypothetical protein REPUB_Repub14bG0143300 [Reevesia pubescens]
MDISSPVRNVKNLKVGLEQNFDEGRGRICCLPDTVLNHILSFLPTKEAVRTSVLSKRWQFMWTSITKLNFDEQVYMFKDDERAKRRRIFMNFVERVLLLCESPNIEEFSLICEVLSDESRINSWISAAVRHKVQRLTLHFPREMDDRSFMLPHCLFTCESLKELDVDIPYVLKLPSYICFPSLKILNLENITFPDAHSAQFFSACPNLMKLSLRDCLWNVKAVHISAPMLENVDIYEGGYSSPMLENVDIYEGGYSSYCQFMISGMNLQFFLYTGEFKDDLCIFDAPSLDKAIINVLGDVESDGRRVAAYRGFKLLMGLANVKSLQVTPEYLKLLASAEELLSHLPSLYNLKHLVVEDFDNPGDFGCRGLMKILQNSPHLESLHFITGMELSAYHEKDDWTIDPVPPCFLTHLKTIKFRFFNASDEELHLVTTLLRTARVLEKLYLPTKMGKKIPDLLLTLPKGSVNCDVVFF